MCSSHTPVYGHRIRPCTVIAYARIRSSHTPVYGHRIRPCTVIVYARVRSSYTIAIYEHICPLIIRINYPTVNIRLKITLPINYSIGVLILFLYLLSIYVHRYNLRKILYHENVGKKGGSTVWHKSNSYIDKVYHTTRTASEREHPCTKLSCYCCICTYAR
jgi:hypothetical protein